MDMGWIWDGYGMDMGWIWDGYGMDGRYEQVSRGKLKRLILASIQSTPPPPPHTVSPPPHTVHSTHTHTLFLFPSRTYKYAAHHGQRDASVGLEEGRCPYLQSHGREQAQHVLR